MYASYINCGSLTGNSQAIKQITKANKPEIWETLNNKKRVQMLREQTIRLCILSHMKGMFMMPTKERGSKPHHFNLLLNKVQVLQFYRINLTEKFQETRPKLLQ